jgi:lipid-A-disaccharide synthase
MRWWVFVEVLKHFSWLKSLFETTLEWICAHRPQAVCFVDLPGFNLRIAKELNLRGVAARSGGPVKLLYYISPQIWAWKAHRRFAMARQLDALGVIFPFEIASYEDTTLPVTFVGHPFVEPDYQSPLRYDPSGPLLLLPGSRRTPIQRIFPRMLQTWNALRKERPELHAVVMYPTEKIRRQLEELLTEYAPGGVCDLVPNHESLAVRGMLSSSGTISLVCALAGIPGAIVYCAHPLSYLMAKALAKVKLIGIANLILGQMIHPEYLQGQFTPSTLAAILTAQWDDPETRAKTAALSEELRTRLSGPDSMAVARWVLDSGFSEKASI